MKIKTAEFITSVANSDRLNDYGKAEIAFVGRSNVGKSSLVNALTGRKKLAKTSSTPGRTRLINVFEINGEFILIDLPGYGYAKASKSEQGEWQKLIGGYLEKSKNLKCVFVLVDIRHKPSVLDKTMLEYLYHYNIPFKVVATKNDKISRSQIKRYSDIIANELGLGHADILNCSSEKRVGIEKLLEEIDSILANL